MANSNYQQSGPAEEEKGLFKILFLGTGASDWPFGSYPKGKEILVSGLFRGSSSLLLSNEVLVDCGPSVPEALSRFEVDCTRLRDIFITHTHADHFCLDALRNVAGRTGSDVRLWVEKGAAPKVEKLKGSFRIREMVVGKTVDPAGCRILPLPAGHQVGGSREIPLNFLISAGKSRILYALDGAWLSKAAWKAVKDLVLDVLVWDATIGDIPADSRVFGHNNLPMIRILNQALRSEGVLGDSTRIILSHLSRDGHPGHFELCRGLAKEGMEAAFDGMEVEI